MFERPLAAQPTMANQCECDLACKFPILNALLPQSPNKRAGAHGWKPQINVGFFKSGAIEFDRGAFSCTIRNLSEGGAALDVSYPTL